ncbi:MAG: cobalamin biosynthesis protein CobG, partial [Pseudomonadota bacterium]
MTITPEIKGWCPGALRPMMSGDGLIVRIRPPLGWVSQQQVLGLCDIADTQGNGTIDLTSRANLQMRGVRDHDAVVAALGDLNLIDPDPVTEAKRNITT